jgi:hypothetical protein
MLNEDAISFGFYVKNILNIEKYCSNLVDFELCYSSSVTDMGLEKSILCMEKLKNR